MFLSIVKFLGRFHPLIVHLPIGILLIALLLQYLAGREKYTVLSASVPVLLFVGMLSAFASCITGYLLWLGGGYEDTVVGWHMWMGISVAMVSLLVYARRKTGRMDTTYKLMSIGLFVLILITGHLGGSLTHGSDYLSSALGDSPEAIKVKRKPIADVQQAVVFNDVIQPILMDKCYGCHGPTKQKGKLRMDRPELLMTGGKHGVVIKPGKAEESELIKRILLPREDDHHMAPKEKPQLTQQEVALLSWWVAEGASFNKKVNELAQPGKIKPVLLSLQQGSDEENDALADAADTDVPQEAVAKADEKAIALLRQRGVIVLPVALNSNYLEVRWMNDPTVIDKDIALLRPLQKQLLSLKLGYTPVTDSSLSMISSLTGLIRLRLDHTKITDKGLSSISTLSQLKYINLAGTAITSAGVKKLQALKKLKTIYLYQTMVNKKEWAALQASFPGVQLDSGAYIVPLLATDTTLVKQGMKK